MNLKTVTLIIIGFALLSGCVSQKQQVWQPTPQSSLPVEVMFENSTGYLFGNGDPSNLIYEINEAYQRHFFEQGAVIMLCSLRNETSGDCVDRIWNLTIPRSPSHQMLITNDGTIKPFKYSEIYN